MMIWQGAAFAANTGLAEALTLGCYCYQPYPYAIRWPLTEPERAVSLVTEALVLCAVQHAS